MSHSYEAKLEAKRDHYLAMAAKADQESNATSARSSAITGNIPMGQPILVGHHSEKRHRRDLQRSWDAIGKSVELERKAEYYRQKAASVGTGGVSSLDDEAIDKLNIELSERETRQAMMKEINRVWRVVQKDPEASKATKALALLTETYGEGVAEQVKTFEVEHSWEKGPYAGFTMTNNNASIRRIKKRIADVTALQAKEEFEDQGDHFTFALSEGRYQFGFDGKPAVEVRSILKGRGFKWSPSRSTWVRLATGNGKYAAKCVRNELNQHFEGGE